MGAGVGGGASAFFEKSHMLRVASGTCTCCGGLGKRPTRWYIVQQSALRHNSEHTCDRSCAEGDVRYRRVDLREELFVDKDFCAEHCHVPCPNVLKSRQHRRSLGDLSGLFQETGSGVPRTVMGLARPRRGGGDGGRVTNIGPTSDKPNPDDRAS